MQRATRILGLSTAVLLWGLGCSLTSLDYLSSERDKGATSDAGPDAPPWKPPAKAAWQYQLDGPIDTAVDAEVFVVDLFDTPSATVNELHGKGRKVAAWFSAGTLEAWRSDGASFPSAAQGNPIATSSDEKWLDIRAGAVREGMKTRLKEAQLRGFDAVVGANLDSYTTGDSGFPLTLQDASGYAAELSAASHALGLAFALENAAAVAQQTSSTIDFAVVVDCLRASGECGDYDFVRKSGKPVLNAEAFDTVGEAQSQQAALCPKATGKGLSSILKTTSFDAWRLPCP
ncbi:MAG: endo alpha-1,4 polygalactosaminidase [Deltaproteobacteria bacterium]|nr:endo alpha-1,4 polygalactosaminidase [Deltaproteobacteria bacterium]